VALVAIDLTCQKALDVHRGPARKHRVPPSTKACMPQVITKQRPIAAVLGSAARGRVVAVATRSRSAHLKDGLIRPMEAPQHRRLFPARTLCCNELVARKLVWVVPCCGRLGSAALTASPLRIQYGLC
jgi:hypothetical protein